MLPSTKKSRIEVLYLFHRYSDSTSAPGERVPLEFQNKKLLHVCEVCGKREILTPEEGFKAGWDYAPYMYPFKVISPRTCGSCSITATVWWEIAVNHKSFDELTDAQKEVVMKIYNEPESILPRT